MDRRLNSTGMQTEPCDRAGRAQLSTSDASMPTPLISVIVVCRNPGPRLHDALGSVWAQAEVPVEIVVIDGASTDGTPDWLRSQSSQLGAWLSEPDGGVYDAMNKGFRLCRGSWVLYLGADDMLATSGVLEETAPVLARSDAAVVAGAALYDDNRLYRPAPNAHAIRRNFIHHQAAFYRRTALSSMGEYDASLRFQADYDLNLRLLASGSRIERIETLVARCARGGLSDAGHWANYREEIRVRHRHYTAWRCLPWDALASMRWLRKRARTQFRHA